MKSLLGILLIVVSSHALAHELDNENTVSTEQIDAAKILPRTTVIRVNKNDPTDVAIVHLNEKVAAGTNLENLKFQEVAINTEIRELNFDSTNEKDLTSSTSSWGFANYNGPRRNFGYYNGPNSSGAYYNGPRVNAYAYSNNNYYPRYNNGYYPNYNYSSYYRPSYVVQNSCINTPYYNYEGCGYYPQYYVNNYSYQYSSYYSYSSSYYDYNCYTW